MITILKQSSGNLHYYSIFAGGKGPRRMPFAQNHKDTAQSTKVMADVNITLGAVLALKLKRVRSLPGGRKCYLK